MVRLLKQGSSSLKLMPGALSLLAFAAFIRSVVQIALCKREPCSPGCADVTMGFNCLQM
jgi:hypothetical protein